MEFNKLQRRFARNTLEIRNESICTISRTIEASTVRLSRRSRRSQRETRGTGGCPAIYVSGFVASAVVAGPPDFGVLT